jgi:hypothetical protein
MKASTTADNMDSVSLMSEDVSEFVGAIQLQNFE